MDMDMGKVVYDLETFPNAFTACFSPVDADGGSIFEISDRRDDSVNLLSYIETLNCMIGFNNLGFDWPILQFFREHPGSKAPELYEMCQRIIGSEDRFEYVIWNPAIRQIDLYRVHHFDNRAKATSLKKLQFNMRSRLVQDLPFDVGTHLSHDEIAALIEYNIHDVLETKAFWFKSLDKIELREKIEPMWMNASDSKIGRNYFVRELEDAGVTCFVKPADSVRKVPVNSVYPSGVKLEDVILPYLWSQVPEISKALDVLKSVVVTDMTSPDGEFSRMALLPSEPAALPNIFKEHTFMLDGVEITMGLGGLHGSIDHKVVENCNILDLDVTSFYPSISIKNKIFPKHLGISFCTVYQKLLERRLATKKGTPENSAIKLALNSVFGSAGSPYTCFYDLAFMLGITINGQFLILSLVEVLLAIPGVRLIQVNTDGVTIVVPDGKEEEVQETYRAWQAATHLPLEASHYRRFWIRDVNNYIAEYMDGRRKRKGAYQAEREWHQNRSMAVVRKAAEAVMCDGQAVGEFLEAHNDPWDFLLRLDLTRNSYLHLSDGRQLKGVVRYYVSKDGVTATKYTPKTQSRIHGKGHATCSGKRGEYKCSECEQCFKTKAEWSKHNDLEHSSKLVIAQEYTGGPILFDINFYAAEVEKLLITERFVP